MGTDKRERQKANRQARLEELARQAKREKSKRWGILIGGGVVLALVLLFVLTRLTKSDSKATTPSTSAVPSTVAEATSTSLDTSSSVATGSTVPGDSTTSGPGTTIPGDSTTSSSTTSSTTTTLPFKYGTAPCPNADGSSAKPATFAGAPQLCIDPNKTYTALVTTNFGTFTITLDAKRFPGQTNNFVVLARYHYYDGTGCHRVIKNFVVQCGRPGTDEKAPGYTIPDELPAAGDYTNGVVAMANTGSANSGGGQWYVIVGKDGTALPPSYSILGKVTQGYNSTVAALVNLADPLAANGVPPLKTITITSVTITES